MTVPSINESFDGLVACISSKNKSIYQRDCLAAGLAILLHRENNENNKPKN